MNKPQLPFHCLGMERTTRFLCDAQMLNLMADGLPGIVAYYDVDLVCHFVNATVEAWTGALAFRLPQPTARARRIRDFGAAAKPGIERALAGDHAEFEAKVDFAGGMVNVVRGFAYPDQDQNGRVLGCFVLLLDITRERAFEAQMQAARDEAMEAIRSKSRFLAAASHDLRQPLHAMTLFVSALSRRLSGGESGELVGNLDNSLRSLRAMIDTLLDISKLDAGLVKPSLAPLALSDLFAALEPGFSAVARDRGLAFRVVPTAAMVVGDRTLVELAMRNLIANAFKFTRGGGVLVGCRRRRGRIGVAVADTGVGVASDRQARVFEEFHRDKTTPNGPNEGIGLGLSIVQRLAALMGGAVELRSRPGKGSVFTLWLREAAQAPRPVRRADAPEGSLAGRRILILDDDAAERGGDEAGIRRLRRARRRRRVDSRRARRHRRRQAGRADRRLRPQRLGDRTAIRRDAARTRRRAAGGDDQRLDRPGRGRGAARLRTALADQAGRSARAALDADRRARTLTRALAKSVGGAKFCGRTFKLFK